MRKSSLLSIAAAGVLTTAMLTGCGGGGGGSTASPTTTPTPTTTGIQSSVTATDGYIYNADAYAYYLSEDNSTMKKVSLVVDKNTTKDASTGTWTEGSPVYKLPADFNQSLKPRLKFFVIKSRASSTQGTTFIPATYIESDNKAGWDTNDTLLGNTVIYAPATSKVASPLVSMIYDKFKTTLFGTENGVPATKVDINSTTIKDIENNATTLAKKLGLGDVNPLIDDPVQLAEKNPTYRLVTALLKGAQKADFDAIMNENDAKTLEDTLSIIANKTNAEGKALAQALLTKVKNGAITDVSEIVKQYNIEKSVVNHSLKSLTPPDVKGKFPVYTMEINGTDTDELIGKGDKIDKNNFIIDISTASNMDKNISTSNFKVVVAVKGNKPYVAHSDSNNSGALAVEVPFELNATDGNLHVKVPDDAIVPYEAKNSNGSQIIYKNDYNASALGVNNAITASGRTLSIKVGDIINNVISNSADANLSGTTGLGSSNFNITDVQVYLVDDNGKIIGTDSSGENSEPLPKGDFNSLAGNIAAPGAIKVYANNEVDLRGNKTKENSAPNNDIIITKGAVANNMLGSQTKDNNRSKRIVVNNNSAIDLNLTASTNDNWEKNTTVSFKLDTNFMTDKNLTTIKNNIKTNSTADAFANNAIEFNTTSTTTGDLNTSFSYTVTDEFGEKNTTTVYFRINRAPVLGALAFHDKNLSEGNITNILILKDYDLDAVSATVKVVDQNTGILIPLINGTPVEVNLTGTQDYNITLADNNLTIDLNGTGMSDDVNITLNFTNVRDQYGFYNTDINDTNHTLKH